MSASGSVPDVVKGLSRPRILGRYAEAVWLWSDSTLTSVGKSATTPSCELCVGWR